MKRILTYGTFDLLHYGHIRILKRAKELGDYLVVALSTDEFNANSAMVLYQLYISPSKLPLQTSYFNVLEYGVSFSSKANIFKLSLSRLIFSSKALEHLISEERIKWLFLKLRNRLAKYCIVCLRDTSYSE